MLDLEIAAMEIVGSAGESKSLCFEALEYAKKGEFQIANEKIAKAKEVFLKAHEVQTELICAEADGQDVNVGILMVHAQDHLMTSLLARDLIEEIINLYQIIKK